VITKQEIKELGHSFWTIVRSGVHGSEAEHLFINPGILAPNGAWLPLEPHQALHRTLKDEVHEWEGDCSIRVLSENPERVQFNGTVHWEATIIHNNARIVSEVGEQWIVERCDDGRLRFTNYWSNSFEYADGSAELVV
jgi:hypothetical protein